MINSGCPSLESIIKLGSKIQGPRLPVQSYLNIGNIEISEPIATPPDTHMPTDDLLLLFFLAAFYIFFDLLSA